MQNNNGRRPHKGSYKKLKHDMLKTFRQKGEHKQVSIQTHPNWKTHNISGEQVVQSPC